MPKQKSLHLSLSKHSLVACSILSPLLATLSCMYVFPYLIHPSYNWPSSPPRTLNFTHIHFLCKLFTFLSLKTAKPSQSISFNPFHYITLCSSFTRSHTRFHCSYPPILSPHMLLSDNSFPQHTLLTDVLSSMFKSV